MATLIRPHAVVRPHETAVLDEHGPVTWAQLDDRVNRWVHLLRHQDLGVGDRICLLAGNRRETFEVLLACVHAGLTVVPVNWHLTAPEIAYHVADSGARGLVCDEERVSVAAESVRQLDRSPDVRLVLNRSGCSYGEGFEPAEPLLAGETGAEPDAQLSGELMMYTSGTTGAPKGVLNGLLKAGATLDRVTRLLDLVGAGLGVPDGGSTLLVGPWYHSAQLFFSLLPLLRGSRLVTRSRFTPPDTLEVIDRERIGFAHFVPTHFVRLLRLDPATRNRFRGTSLVRVWHGGGACPVDVKQHMIDWWGRCVFLEYYGATEGGVATVIDSAEWLTRPGSVGRAYPPNQIMVVDDAGQALPAGRTGRVFVRRSAHADFHYHGAPEKTRRAHLGPGMFTYGDLGYLDEDGYLYLAGRADGTIVSGGVNVYPAEVEAVLLAHPAVRDAAVLGVPDDEFGERVEAVVELAADVETAVLDQFCRTRLAGFKTPRGYRVVKSMPRTEAGKVRFEDLRRLVLQGQQT